VKTVQIFALALVCLAGCSQSPDAQARSRQRDVIRRCWDEQEKKSLSPELARFVAGTCEKLEANYRTKWNREP
jgi:hypothetical protein